MLKALQISNAKLYSSYGFINPAATGFTQNVDTLFSDLHNLTKSETVLGNPVTVEGKTLIPLMSVTFGMKYWNGHKVNKVDSKTISKADKKYYIKACNI